jgi:hypothetical protein
MGDRKVLEGNRKCALCEGDARMYCESDDAMLCWDCDARVHGANFLVARHARALLCRSCRAPTTWKTSGSRLTPTVSLCSRCCFGSDSDGNHGLIEGDTRSSEDDEEEDDEFENGNDEEEEGDNQVVPWGMPVSVTITPPVASTSSSDGSTLKRARNCLVDHQSSSPRKVNYCSNFIHSSINLQE